MDAYCRSDVDILRRCCLEFRKQFLDITKVDPFCYVTIASDVMAVFRSLHIRPNTIAMIPAHGYINTTNYSNDSIRWLDYVAMKEAIQISHALNRSGELKIDNYSVDGFCEATNTVYQYHGCFFHGCDQCYEPDMKHPLSGTSMRSLLIQTKERTAYIRRKGYTVQEMWEHDFVLAKKNDEDLKDFLRDHTIVDRLNPRDAFFGGRTNAIKLYHEGPSKYVDFTSLYPWTNKYCRYPIGHPRIITENFESLDNYFGIIKCHILPPKGLYHPVLPLRINGKLIFPLCRTCAENEEKSPCNHSDNERVLLGTWISEEVKKAVQKQYRIIKMHEVYHFEDSSNDLFRTYINMFLKIKQEASGWPSHCVSEEDRKKYVEDYFENEGISLDPTKIETNPGRRQVAKLALNSFWGRWGMNLNKTQLKYVTTLAEFNKVLSDKTKEVNDLYFPTPEVAAIQFRLKSAFLEQESNTNIFLASFTTAYARLKLYKEVEKLDRAVLYMDTDSIIYSSDGQNDPPLGDYLGQFTDELNGGTIQTFVSGGPKNYAYKTDAGTTVCKIRGFSLNFKNSLLLNFESMRSLVMDMEWTKTIAVYNPAKISRDAKSRKIFNKEVKQYKLVYTKRVIQDDLTTLPYGY